MNIVPKLLLIFSSLSLFTLCVDTQKCDDYQCNSPSIYGTKIRFPFREVDHQPKPCGYPGFDLRCNGTKARLELPNSVIFQIDWIYYDDQEIGLSDLDNCLPSKLLSLNLSTSPFYALYYQKFAVFNCSGNFDDGEFNGTSDYDLHKVDCLSGLSYTVYAVNELLAVSLLSSACNWVKNISVPNDYGFSLSTITSHGSKFTLHWDEPRWGTCENIHRRCRVKEDSTHGIECMSKIYPSDESNEFSSKSVTIPLVIGLPAVLMLAILVLMGWIKSRRQRNESAMTGSIATRVRNNTTTRISQSTLDSYPTIVINENAGQLVTSEDNTCSICLSEYKMNEVLKILPYCLHRFHVPCIDQWLILDGTCPICRLVPTQPIL